MFTHLQLKNLGKLRRDLEFSLAGFPRSQCCEASKQVKRAFGFEIICGRFFEGHRYVTHLWNCISDGLFLDLTADQFDFSIPKVYVFTEDYRYDKRHF